MDYVNFWNGNKTGARQSYETELLRACLSATEAIYGASLLLVDNTDYPLAEHESNIFESGADILVTVAGNQKFEHKQKIVINQPLTKGLLGYRLILLRTTSLAQFVNLEAAELQTLSIGIPATWADAELFRKNNYNVVEKGAIDELFVLLKEGVFDYTALGANEIEETFQQYAEPLGGISIEPSAMIYYPLPLLFYVNPGKPALAKRLQAGLKTIMDNGDYEKIFNKHHGDIVQRLNLKQRKIFTLHNPFLPSEIADFKPTLLD